MARCVGLLLAAILTRGSSFAPPVALATPSSSSNPRRSPVPSRRFPFLAANAVVASSTPAADAAADVIVAAPTLPTWEELNDTLTNGDDDASNDEQQVEPLATLYRDTNGWCPFCERVWVALRAKDVPYAEQLISLQDKPDWYKALVPTALVPAVLFHGSNGNGNGEEGEGGEGKNERRIVWESMDILRALDDAFPDRGPRLIHDTPEFDAALAMNDDLTAAGFGYVYANRNGTLTDEEKEERRAKFMAELDRLDRALLDVKGKDEGEGEGGGPFRLGSDFTGMDAIMVPTLERWRYQLPITAGIDILENRPGLVRWFEAMDSYGPYADRVAGDEYSWTATNSMFLRYFGGGEDRPEVADAIRRADEAADRLTSSFADAAAIEGGDEEAGGTSPFAMEAARKLISNHDAVVRDCTRPDPASQQHIPRAAGAEEAADAVLRYVASVLLSPGEGGVMEAAKSSPMVGPFDKDGGGGGGGGDSSAAAAAVAARTIASRLCVPRDMGAPAAKILRGVLAIVAGRLEEMNS